MEENAANNQDKITWGSMFFFTQKKKKKKKS